MYAIPDDLNVPRDRDRNVKNSYAPIFIECFKILFIMMVGQHVWYLFPGKRTPYTIMPILLIQSDQVWIFGMSKECRLFIYLCTVYYLITKY